MINCVNLLNLIKLSHIFRHCSNWGVIKKIGLFEEAITENFDFSAEKIAK